jgi:hypothetical protein
VLPALGLVALVGVGSGERTDETQRFGDNPGDIPICDTHVHYKQPAWSLYTPAEIIELMERAGVPRALVSSSPDEGTLMLYRDPDWRRLFLKHSDRVTIGSDTWVNSRWEQYESILDFDRTWLAQLPDDVARKIAYENAVRLFGTGATSFPTR